MFFFQKHLELRFKGVNLCKFIFLLGALNLRDSDMINRLERNIVELFCRRKRLQPQQQNNKKLSLPVCYAETMGIYSDIYVCRREEACLPLEHEVIVFIFDV